MNMAQELQFERLKLARFNSFDGEYVGHLLRIDWICIPRLTRDVYCSLTRQKIS
jgi:hypothetical protein